MARIRFMMSMEEDEFTRCLAKALNMNGMEKPAQEKVELELSYGSSIDVVLEHYRKHHPRQKKLAQHSKICKLIKERLSDGFGVFDLKKAIDGAHMSPWHKGENPTGRKYLGLGLIFRDSEKVEQFISYYENPPVKKFGQGVVEDNYSYDDGEQDL